MNGNPYHETPAAVFVLSFKWIEWQTSSANQICYFQCCCVLKSFNLFLSCQLWNNTIEVSVVENLWLQQPQKVKRLSTLLLTYEMCLNLCYWLYCCNDFTFSEWSYLLQHFSHCRGVVRPKNVTRSVRFLPVKSCKHHSWLLANKHCMTPSSDQAVLLEGGETNKCCRPTVPFPNIQLVTFPNRSWKVISELYGKKCVAVRLPISTSEPGHITAAVL